MKCQIKHFDCPGCGAQMLYSPKKQKMHCPYCGSSKDIPFIARVDAKEPLKELFSQDISPKKLPRDGQCPKCGANNRFENFIFARECEYCNTPLITDYSQAKKPQNILPFRVDEREAKTIFTNWIGSLWFAPSELKRVVDRDKSLDGIYIPYWLFDADTVTAYSGMRGDAYYETQSVRRVINGREEIVQEQVRKIRWTPVSGIVSRDFRDIPILADETLPISILNRIEPWDAKSARKFDEAYVSGFDGKEYSRDIKSCHSEAVSKMDSIIEMDIRRDIGGDEQRIESINTRYSDEKSAHILLPIWTTSFRYKGKEYRYVINGFNGRVSGERPYSYWKIAGLVTAILLILSLIAYWDTIKSYFGY